MLPIETGPLLASVGLTLNSLGSSLEAPNSPDRTVTLMTEIRCFQEIIAKFKEMRVDPTEYACLKAIVLFKTGTL